MARKDPTLARIIVGSENFADVQYQGLQPRSGRPSKARMRRGARVESGPKAAICFPLVVWALWVGFGRPRREVTGQCTSFDAPPVWFRPHP